MAKLIWTIVSIILTVAVLLLPAVRNWIINIYSVITQTVAFFAVMPAWFNFLISTVVIFLVIYTARQLRD